MKLESLFLMVFLIILVASSFAALGVQSVKVSGTIYIRDDGSVDPYDAPISTIDNVTYTLTGNITGDYGSALLLERDNIVVDGSAHTIEGVPEYGIGIWLNGRNNVTIRNMNVLNFRIGIYLDSCSLISINANTIEKCYLYGIWLHSSSLISIYGNSLARNWNGIWLDSSSGNTISANSETNNGMGIFLICSSNNSISGNDITNGGDIYDGGGGIHLSLSSNNSIAGNNIADNGYVGIRISSSTNNSISENTIANNSHGIIFSQYRGDFTLGPLSSFNSIWHDNFINNTVQVGGDDIYLSGWVEFWDNGCEGNYWSNYNGTDANPDGIGDTEYVIDANNTDNYPLMGMFSEFDWVSLAAPEQRIQTICNSTISDLVYNGTAISFNVTGEDGTAGFCRINIPTILLNVTYKVFVNGTEVTYRLLPFSNETYTYLYFNYTHPKQRVMIIPEFPSFLILPLFFMATLLAVITYRRKHH